MKKADAAQNLLRRPPLYQQAADRLRQELRTMKPGDCLPSERLLAERYGVSLTTVREAVRILASQKLVTRRQGLGTFIAPPPERPSGLVAFVIHHDISHPGTSAIYLKITQEIRVLLDAEGIASRLYISRRAPGLEQTDLHCPEFFRDLEAGEISGVIGILLAAHSPWFRMLEERGIMLIGYGSGKPYSVAGCSRTFYQNAVNELLRRGRRRLALLAWGGYPAHRTRHAAIFREVASAAGLPVNEEWIRDDIYPGLDGAGWGGFREIWSARRDRPDGLVIADDLFLPGVAAAIAEGGIEVPEQLEIAALLSNDIWCPFPVLGWQENIEAIARALFEAGMRVLRGQKVEPGDLRISPLPSKALSAGKMRDAAGKRT